MSKESELEQASDMLELMFFEQDWGIINASASRIEEFIDYFNLNCRKKGDALKLNMFELVIASFNTALLEEMEEETEGIFKRFIKLYAKVKLYEPVLSYWIAVGDEGAFPVGKYLEKYTATGGKSTSKTQKKRSF